MASKGTKYVLHYWGGIPGRGEFIRLAFESVGHPYTEQHKPQDVTMKKSPSHPPSFAPPVLEVQEGSSSSSYIGQTPAILAYLAPILHLDGVTTEESSAASVRRAHVNQVTFTILDLNNEVHDVHHPIASAAYYEDQKEEAIKRAKDFRGMRIPKFFTLFQLTLESNPESKEWLIGRSFTIADLALFQVCVQLEL
jgi:glutathione S-transferase